MKPRRILCGMRVVVLFIALMYFNGPAVAEAQSLTPGSVDLSSTFEAISVRAHFSGDSNANATATRARRKQIKGVSLQVVCNNEI